MTTASDIRMYLQNLGIVDVAGNLTGPDAPMRLYAEIQRYAPNGISTSMVEQALGWPPGLIDQAIAQAGLPPIVVTEVVPLGTGPVIPESLIRDEIRARIEAGQGQSTIAESMIFRYDLTRAKFGSLYREVFLDYQAQHPTASPGGVPGVSPRPTVTPPPALPPSSQHTPSAAPPSSRPQGTIIPAPAPSPYVPEVYTPPTGESSGIRWPIVALAAGAALLLLGRGAKGR